MAANDAPSFLESNGGKDFVVKLTNVLGFDPLHEGGREKSSDELFELPFHQ